MKWILSFILIALSTITIFAQAPEKMSYQGIIRDSKDKLVNSSKVAVKILIKQGSENGSSVFEEVHYTETNANGLVSFQIGTGTRLINELGKIDWSQGPYFIESRVDTKGGTNYSISGISQMLSVPYALHAKSSEIFTGTISASQISDFDFKVNANNSAFNDWDKNKNDDFSGDYQDLINIPELYTKEEIDRLFVDVDILGGVPQTIDLIDDRLSISGGNSITLSNWDTDVSDDFSGNYKDLADLPELYNREEINGLIANIESSGGIPQFLNLEEKTLSISNGNSISFDKWDTNASDDFSGQFDDLQNKPELYDKTEIDNLINGIETTGGVPQNLSLDNSSLSISGGNSISFDNWDINASDDFSGQFDDLLNKPELYDKTEIDNLINGIETIGGVPQNLSLDNSSLSISGGNSISFDNWDTNASDDFSGQFDDLQNKPELYNKTEIDNLINGIETNGGTPQNLSLDNSSLSISGGNSISFDNWDTNASDDFDGEYSSLTGAPKLYTQDEVDNIKIEILKEVEDNYLKKAKVVSLTSSRNISNNDVRNTIACINSTTLTISSGFTAMNVGDWINVEVHGTTLTVNGASGVIINGKSGGNSSIGNNEIYTGGIIRKTGNNSYIVL